MTSSEPVAQRVFLDADVLASPLTRTILLVSSRCGDGPVFVPVWSQAVESEADKHARPGQAKVVDIRATRWGDSVIIPDATPGVISQLADTDVKDRHVLAAAQAAGLHLIVTRNVRHFGRQDLARLEMSVAHPDAFLAAILTKDAYRAALELIAETRRREPKTPEGIHAALGREHPRLAAAMRDVFPGVEPLPGQNEPPAEVFRGVRCMACGKRLSSPESLSQGVGPECRTAG